MNRGRFLAAALVLAAAACGRDAVESPAAPTGDQPSFSASDPTDRYIVVLRDDVVGVQAVTDRMVQAAGTTADFVYGHALKGFAARLTPQALAALRADPMVDFITPDGIMTIGATQAPTPSWGLDRIDQRNLPLNNSYTYPNSGAGVHFYGIDTGILGGINGTATTPHVDIAGRLSTGHDAITPGGTANDCNGHGTHTATTAAGTTYGVAKSAVVHPVRVLNCAGSGTFAQVIAGINWVTMDHQNHPGQQSVANMSLGGGLDPATNTAVRNSIAAGVTYSLSAGNSFGADACTQSPAAVTEGITVMAFSSIDRIANFSNIGPCTDLGGPGVGITAGWIGSPTATNTIDGTSMSAPHVAGAAMLYLAANPGSTPAQVQTALVSNGTVGIISGSTGGAFPANTPNVNLFMGFIGGGGPPNNPPVADFTWSCSGLTCTFDGTSSTDDNGVTGYSWTAPNGSVVSTSAVFTRTFNSPRTFNLTLTVSDAGGLTNSQTQTITVTGGGGGSNPPVASFTWSCTPGRLCTFDGTGSSDDVGIVSYNWSGPGGNSVSTSPSFTNQFNGPKTFTLTLTVTDGDGQTNSQSQSVTVP